MFEMMQAEIKKLNIAYGLDWEVRVKYRTTGIEVHVLRRRGSEQWSANESFSLPHHSPELIDDLILKAVGDLAFKMKMNAAREFAEEIKMGFIDMVLG